MSDHVGFLKYSGINKSITHLLKLSRQSRKVCSPICKYASNASGELLYANCRMEEYRKYKIQYLRLFVEIVSSSYEIFFENSGEYTYTLDRNSRYANIIRQSHVHYRSRYGWHVVELLLVPTVVEVWKKVMCLLGIYRSGKMVFFRLTILLLTLRGCKCTFLTQRLVLT